MDVKTHTLIGIEALARWRQGQDNLMPLSFISVLERDGCITILDFYILEEACRFLRRLIDENMEPVRVSVNFSKRHLTNDRLVAQIMEVIDRYGISHEYIVVELTESEDYQNNRVMAGIVEQLRTEGVKTSIDDFGTGYSSLAMLNTLRVDELKIDRSFIPKNPADGSDKGLFMLKGIINLAKGLGLSAVAEGVETPEQLELIESLGCDAVQGFIFDKPLPEEELIERIKNRRYT
ncbi:MAG: EAL domain-containing protein [Acetatifactor sp.]